MTERLAHKQTAAMLTLMVLAREVSNTELKTIVGFPLDGKYRLDLNKRGLVVSHKQGRAYAHELTDLGWAWCGDEIKTGTPPPPTPRSLLAPTFYLLLAALDDYLRRANLRLADVFVPAVELTPEEIESRIRAAYRELAPAPRDWVALADLRLKLGDAPRKDVDAVLKAMSSVKQAVLVPDSNRKALTPADHEAAIRVGGEANHLLSIETS
ncbi:MAG TPA: hypothetical protein VFX16_03310 [Pseudonocardiaceae bacterium]|nr:hypothetical protein [Pseudonocardiaceae bacterium]